MCSMGTMANKTILHIWKWLREETLNIIITRIKTLLLCMVTDVNQTYCGDHFVIYTNVKCNVVCQVYLS